MPFVLIRRSLPGEAAAAAPRERRRARDIQTAFVAENRRQTTASL